MSVSPHYQVCDCCSIYQVSIAQWLECWHGTPDALGFEFRLRFDFSPSVTFGNQCGAQTHNPEIKSLILYPFLRLACVNQSDFLKQAIRKYMMTVFMKTFLVTRYMNSVLSVDV